MTRRRVIFVDDDPRLLRALRRTLDSMREDWELFFAESGPDALEVMATTDFDAVVSDMRMPGMDGAQLLHEVQRRYPTTVRVVLSGQSDQETRLRAVGPTHQFLAKPCDEETLRATLTRACDLRDLLARDSLRQLVTQLHVLPSHMGIEQELRAELTSPDPSIRRLGELIDDDVALTAKVLQLVNSSFFGVPRRVGSAVEATVLLGVNTIRELVLSEGFFSPYSTTDAGGALLEPLRDHCRLTGQTARAIMAAEQADLAEQGDARLAGQLHDVGLLVLASNLTNEYTGVGDYAREHGVELWQAERELLGSDHGEVGAYLLGIWGLPDAIVEAAAFHHRPGHAPSPRFGPLTAVHVADVLAAEAHGYMRDTWPEVTLDDSYLEALGLAGRVEAWRAAAAEARTAA